MKPVKALVVNCRNDCLSAMEDALAAGNIAFEATPVDGGDEALEIMVGTGVDVCLIRSDNNSVGQTTEMIANAREAGLRTPIIVLMEIYSLPREQEYTTAGALAAIPWDGTDGSILRNIIRLAISLRDTEASLRRTNNQMLQDMATLQDARERAESINEEYIQMAEELALARDELEKLNSEKNKFFSIIAHDLRSPFTALLGYTELIKQMGSDLSREELTEFSNHIHDGATKVFKLLENLLEWSRMQMNRVETEPDDFSLHDIAERTTEVLGPVAKGKNITISIEMPETTVHADANQVDTVIRNLVNNAIKFTDENGNIKITADSNGDFATVSVIDDGQGMSEEIRSKLFKISENVTTNGTKGEKGTGLGLLLCKELVGRNGGEISVTSEPGNGSTFSFTVPLGKAGTGASSSSAA